MRALAVVSFMTLLASFGVQRAAAEDATVVVLGLRSVEGDDGFANAMTDGLREAARKVTGWNVMDRPVSMAQMSLAHGCDDIDTTCLTEIAKGLAVDRMLFGTVRRTAPRKFDFEVTVSVFNNTSRSIGTTQTFVIPRAEAKLKRSLVARAEPVVAKLAESDADVGVLSIQVNVPSAEVRLDDQVVGQTRDKQLLLEGIKVGQHRPEISALGHVADTRSILVAAGERTEVHVDLEPVPEPTPEPITAPVAATEAPVEAESGGSVAWLGYTLIGVGVASLAGWGVSMYLVDNANEDETFKRYKNAFPQREDDVCARAERNDTAGGRVTAADVEDVKSLCSTGQTFNVLQWVFLGAGVVTAGIGTFILATDDGGAEERAQQAGPSLALEPQFGRHSVALKTTVRF